MDNKKLLIIGLVWPEPASSAAGTRMVQLVNLFLSAGYEICFASAAAKSEFSFNLKDIGVEEREIRLNDDGFNIFLKEVNPGMVLFDRFMVEEQYGWRVQQECPGALRILDTEDLHCLRHARHLAIKTGSPLHTVHLFTDVAKREIAAILRCDLSLIISEIEMNILQEQFRIDPSLIYYLPFLEEELSAKNIQSWKNFEQREGFVFIGNFLHEPNRHTLQVLKTEIWPVLRKKLPDATLHIYGAYPSQKILQLHQNKENFHVHGRAKNAGDVISRHKVLLAPIRFGAGVKGKFIEAMQVGTPSVTTVMGAEAMRGELDWNGVITDDPGLFIDAAVQLYQDKGYWQSAQLNGVQIINNRYCKQQFTRPFIEAIKILSLDLTAHRQHNFVGQILQHNSLNSTKYMSLWIAEKNSKGK